jgi:NAD(P)H dehydrogenase (quinone)
MKNIAIVYHSGYGHTTRQAEAVRDGAAAAGAKAALYAVGELDDAKWAELAAADAIVFGAPTYMGSLSAPFKDFMDKSSRVWFTQGWKNKLGAGFTNSASQSGDKLNSLVQLAIFGAQQGMLWVSAGMMPGNNSSKGAVSDLNRLGSYIGVMAQSNADQGAEAMQESDLATAHELGKRVTLAAQAWNATALN